jgi:hypothetical protein
MNDGGTALRLSYFLVPCKPNDLYTQLTFNDVTKCVKSFRERKQVP